MGLTHFRKRQPWSGGFC